MSPPAAPGVVLWIWASQCTHALVPPDCIGAVKRSWRRSNLTRQPPRRGSRSKARQVTALQNGDLSCSPASLAMCRRPGAAFSGADRARNSARRAQQRSTKPRRSVLALLEKSGKSPLSRMCLASSTRPTKCRKLDGGMPVNTGRFEAAHEKPEPRLAVPSCHGRRYR